MIERNPLVSIVTPSYNQAPFLEETILSVLEQNYSRIEYIVIDGGSEDNSIDIIKKYESRLAYWASERDRGQSHAINKGWRRAQGEIWAYLNADDLLASGAISLAAEAFANNPQAGIVHGDCIVIDATRNELETRIGTRSNFNKLLCYGQYSLAQPASFYRAKVVRQVGLLDESLGLAMDYDLLLRLAQVAKMVYIPHVLAYYRVHLNAKSSIMVEQHWKESAMVRARYGGKYLIRPWVKYIKYRIAKTIPRSFQVLFRRWRSLPRDLLYLQSKD